MPCPHYFQGRKHLPKIGCFLSTQLATYLWCDRATTHSRRDAGLVPGGLSYLLQSTVMGGFIECLKRFNWTYVNGQTNFGTTAVPFWGKISQIRYSLSPKRDCGPKRVKNMMHTITRQAKTEKTYQYKLRTLLVNMNSTYDRLLLFQVWCWPPRLRAGA